MRRCRAVNSMAGKKRSKVPRGKVSRNILKNMGIFKVLASGSPSTRKDILKHCDSTLTKAICECTKNVLSGRVPLSRRYYNKLKPYAKHLRKITDKATPLTQKTRVIKQHGGFLTALLGALLPMILGGITRAIAR